MKRALKTKYYIKMLGYDTMVSKVQIARPEYERQMKSLKRQVELSTAYPESEITTFTKRHETEKYIETDTFFNISTSDIILIKLECKEGYCFG